MFENPDEKIPSTRRGTSELVQDSGIPPSSVINNPKSSNQRKWRFVEPQLASDIPYATSLAAGILHIKKSQISFPNLDNELVDIADRWITESKHVSVDVKEQAFAEASEKFHRNNPFSDDATLVALAERYLEEFKHVFSLTINPAWEDRLKSQPSAAMASEPRVPVVDPADKYPNAWADFFPRETPCIYKTGRPWEVRPGPDAFRIEREPRPVCRTSHPIAAQWDDLSNDIKQYLDNEGLKLTAIDPVAYANKGDSSPFCRFIILVVVLPQTLSYETAVTAGHAIKQMIGKLGHFDVDVAFLEGVYQKYSRTPLLHFDPLLGARETGEAQKPFTSHIGLNIAPKRHPHFEGTGSLFYRVSSSNEDLALLTCAHVARPTPIHHGEEFIYRSDSQRREEMVFLGTAAYEKAVNETNTKIAQLQFEIQLQQGNLALVQGNDETAKENRQRFLSLIKVAEDGIKIIRDLQVAVQRDFRHVGNRVIGFVRYSSEIEVAVQPSGFTSDWAMIDLYPDVVNKTTFDGNQLYLDQRVTSFVWATRMYPHPDDQRSATFPDPRGVLNIKSTVKRENFLNPKHKMRNSDNCLFVVKHGAASGTTLGYVNCLKSVHREYSDTGISQDSTEYLVMKLPDEPGPGFSTKGDSGSIVVTREGDIAGIVTGGWGAQFSPNSDSTYITPFYWLEERIKKQLPNYYLHTHQRCSSRFGG